MTASSSAKAGSNALSGNDASPLTLSRAESRKEDRDEGRSGVVGRDDRVRELDRFAPESPLPAPEDMACVEGWSRLDVPDRACHVELWTTATLKSARPSVRYASGKCAVLLVSRCRASVLPASGAAGWRLPRTPTSKHKRGAGKQRVNWRVSGPKLVTQAPPPPNDSG